jgi:hypothetical protein
MPERGGRMKVRRPGYINERHIQIVGQLNALLDEAVKDYEVTNEVVDDFQAYVQDWATQREKEE